MKRFLLVFLALLLTLTMTLTGCELLDDLPLDPFAPDSGDGGTEDDSKGNSGGTEDDGPHTTYANLASIPAYSGSAFVYLNNNVPTFTEDEITDLSYEYFSPLDDLKRCGYVEASVGVDLMPTEPRESISSVTPSGWKNKPYDFVDGGYLYNRCHLLGFQLTGENANKQNLITGTRYMNVDGMLPFENMVADYVRETENHVMLRVTPIYLGDNLVAHGVQMEALSVEDGGADICFNVYIYNVQPRITIDYATGENYQNDVTDYAETAIDGDNGSATLPPPEEEAPDEGGETVEGEEKEYVLNTRSKKIHLPTCSSVDNIAEHNKSAVTATKESLLSDGYSTCGVCKP